MRVGLVSTSLHDDGRRRFEVFATSDLFRYAIDDWTPWPADHPVPEIKTGYWTEQYCSGFFASADAAMSDGLTSHFGSETQP